MKITKTLFFSLLIVFCFNSISTKAQSDYYCAFYAYGTSWGNSFPVVVFTNSIVVPDGSSYPPLYIPLNDPINLTQIPWGVRSANDIVSCAVLNAGSAGVRFTLYKNTDRDYSQGHTIIIAKKAFTGYKLPTFERSFEDEFVSVVFNHGFRGYEPMDGQVSCVIFEKF